MAYLSAKDALTVPDNEFRDALLGIYADVVYPTMPCTNLPGFLDSISSNNSSKPISLLLFQSVMFSSVGFAPIDLLHRHGFQNGRAAREVFFRRVRLLYGLDYETDRLTLIQSLLLMTYWFGGPADVKDTWHWSGIAISLAQECGFHRDPSHLSISDADKRLRRRVWWSCYMRDRLIALGIRRPARLADDEASVPMLTLDDFDHIGPGASPDVAATCVDLASLCVLIGRILHSQYSGLPTHPGGDLTKFAVLPRPWHAREKHVAQLDCALEEWLQIRDPRSIYTPGNASSQRGYLHLHQIQLQIIYLTAVGALHRPQVFCSAPAPAAPGRRESRQKLRQAAGALNKLAFDLRSAGLMGYLFTSSVPAFLSAAIVHLLDVQSADEQTGSLSLGRFYHCVQVLQDLRAIYVSADAAVAFLETVLRMVDVNVPMLANKSAAIAPSDGDIEGDGRAYATPLASENRATNEEMQTGIKEGGQLQDNVDRDFTAQPAGSASEMFLVDSWNGVEGLLPALVNDNSLGVDWDLSQFWNSPEYGGQAV